MLKEKELKAYGDAAQSDEEIGVGEVGCAQRTLNRTSGRKRMAGAARDELRAYGVLDPQVILFWWNVL